MKKLAMEKTQEEFNEWEGHFKKAKDRQEHLKNEYEKIVAFV